jgi:hypothetical protein
MLFPVQFRFDQNLIVLLDQKAAQAGVSRADYLREVVGKAITESPELNITRLNQISEYTAAALAFLIEHFAPEKQHEIIALTGERLEQYHGQK